MSKKLFLYLCLCLLLTANAFAQEAVNGLRITISKLKSVDESLNPEFIIAFENTEKTDYVINLGMMLANGKKLYPTDIHVFLATENGIKKELELKDPAGIAGRVDPYTVPLKSGALYALKVNLNDYWSPKTNDYALNFSKGSYRVSAKYIR